MLSKEMIYEIRESFDDPKKMVRQVVLVFIVMLPFFVFGIILDEPLLLLLEIPVFLILRMYVFTQILDERQNEIQRHASFIGLNISIIVGMTVGPVLMILYPSGEMFNTVGKAILGYGIFQLFINSIAEARYRSKLSEVTYEE